MDCTWLVELAAEFGGNSDLRTVESASGALLSCAGPVMIKIHHRRTDPTLLGARLSVASDVSVADTLLAPLSTAARPTPDGRLATVWPRVEVLRPDTHQPPWAAAGALLARLHRVNRERLGRLPPLRPVDRLERNLRRLPFLAPAAPMLLRTGAAVIVEAAKAPGGTRLVHGDWHLGQLGSRGGRAWRLFDIDDLGVGDPAWDLARPAGFWAAGLVSDADWDAFLTAYRWSGGPAVPSAGDPWPRLDLPARAAVVAAACRTARRPDLDEDDVAEALFEACRQM